MDMILPQPKFKIGDIVFQASIATTRETFPCPDCLGTKKWDAISAAGKQYSFDCPRCGGGYLSNGSLSLSYTTSVPKVNVLTIGSVRFDTANNIQPITYMCRETGVGSGTVYDEKNLFPTQEEAQKAAEIKAKLNNAEQNYIVEQYNAALSVCDYQLSDAALKTSRESIIKWRVAIDQLFYDLEGSETVDEVKGVIEKFKEKQS